jgi:glucose/arabinose dehydrogenase
MRRVAIAVAAFVMVAGCAGDDNEGGDSPDTSTGASEVTTTTVTEGATTLPAPTATLAPDLAAANITLTEVANGLTSPVAIAWRAGDDRIYVVEQPGAIRIVDEGAVLPTPVFEVDVSNANEQGLLGLAFSPDGALMYVDYTAPDGDTHVEEYTMNGDVADVATRRELMVVDQPYRNHNGGQVTIGPDGMLYIGLGDGGSGGDPHGNGQSRSTLLGKILRIDPTPSAGAAYSVPADNPFVGEADVRTEIWMYGLRNPWRFSFDRANGDVWIGDVGQDAREEIDFVPAAGAAGVNWGWNALEGTRDFAPGDAPTDARLPIFELTHDDGNCSVTGGYVYRGQAIPALHGAYVFADYCAGDLIALVQHDGALAEQALLDAQIDEVTSFAEDPNGELYVLSREGSLFRIDPA